jgi:hypothetical protein
MSVGQRVRYEIKDLKSCNLTGPAVKLYASSLGGEWAILFWSCLIFAFLLCEVGNVIQTW